MPETENDEEYEYPENLRYALYIKDGKIQRYVNGKWEVINLHYHEDKYEANQTKTLKIKNNIYDSYTHEYLGDFLRFYRDYFDLDLMPLYNCFSNRLVQNLSIKSINGIFNFDAKDTAYKIYMLPVKIFKKYTIAIDCDSPVEICCGFYGAYQDTRTKLANISEMTYKRLNSINFGKPVIYDLLSDEYFTDEMVTAMEIAQNEHNLKMFIKIPADNNSSITILEGEYDGYNDKLYTKKITSKLKADDSVVYDELWETLQNKTITNYEKRDDIPEVNDRPFKPITSLQLLKLNTGISYPFADRLIEYLIGNAITHEDELYDNVKRAQTIMESYKNLPHFEAEGAWENRMRNIIYDYMNNLKNKSEANHDILGYVDKDVEKYFEGSEKLAGTTIANVFIYPNIYKAYQADQKKKKGGK